MGAERQLPVREPPARVDRRRGRHASSTRLHRRQRDGRDDGPPRQEGPRALPGGRVPRAARRARGHGDVGALRADVRRPARAARAAARQPPAVHAVRGADGVDDARAHVARRRHERVGAGRREPVPAALGLRQRGQAHRARPASPTSRSGGGTRSASTRRGATRTPRRSSRRSRPRSSASSRPYIMRGGEKPKVRKLKEGQVLVEQGQLGNELYLVLDGVLSVDVDGDVARRARAGRDRRRARDASKAVGARRRCGPSPRRGSRWPTRSRSTATRSRQLSEGHRREEARDR